MNAYEVRDLITQVDKTTNELRNTNVKLKKTLNDVIDMINCTLLSVKTFKLQVSTELQFFVSSPDKV